jgi:hypothetical protein
MHLFYGRLFTIYYPVIKREAVLPTQPLSKNLKKLFILFSPGLTFLYYGGFNYSGRLFFLPEHRLIECRK